VATETKLFDISERFSVPISQIAFPSDISIFGSHYGDASYYADFAGLAKKYAPRRILEIGVRFGYSGYAMCLGALAAGMTNVEYVGMDAEYFSMNGVLSNVHAKNNLARLSGHVAATVLSVNTQLQPLPPSVLFSRFQLVNVDGDHSYDGCLKDMNAVWPLLDPGGIMIVDDTGMTDVKRAIETFLSENECQFQWHSNERGSAILRANFSC